jgi:hypothetical protein
MARQRRDDSDLDGLISELTVDCYNEDEELMGFENAFDEGAEFPCAGTVIGEEVQVLSVSSQQGRRELVATCERRGGRYEVSLLDVELQAEPETERLLAAYRRWAAFR